MNKQLIRVEVVAPVHNRRDITLLCLRSLARLDTNGLDIHVVIVDDGSTDGTGDAIRSQFPQVEVVEGDGSLFFTEGTNVCIQAALKYDPKYILLINDDAVFDSAFLFYMVETAEKHERSVIGSLLLLWDTPHKLFQVAPVWDTWKGGWRQWRHQTIWTVPSTPWKVDAIVGNCVLVPAAAIREAGLMNSKDYPNFGDAEYTPRLKRLGWNLLIDPRARVFCQPNNIPASAMKLPLIEKLRVLFFDKRAPHNLLRRFRAMWDTAPSKVHAILAFNIFLARIVLRKNAESNWGERQHERPLLETFKNDVV